MILLEKKDNALAAMVILYTIHHHNKFYIIGKWEKATLFHQYNGHLSQ
jgi:hypothetical protein